MTHLYYVRHAQPNYANHDDAARELSAQGLRDRALVTRYLADKHIDAVLSSPYKRAVDTVAEFAALSGLEIRTVYDLRERRVDRTWIPDFDAFCQKQWADFDYRRAGGETLREVQRRSIRALEAVLTEYEGQSVVIGGHGTALCTLLHYYDPAFGYAGFQSMKDKMPWIVHFVFEGQTLCRLEPVDLK